MANNSWARLITRQADSLLIHEAGSNEARFAIDYLCSIATAPQLADLYQALCDQHEYKRTGDAVGVANARHKMLGVIERIAHYRYGPRVS